MVSKGSSCSAKTTFHQHCNRKNAAYAGPSRVCLVLAVFSWVAFRSEVKDGVVEECGAVLEKRDPSSMSPKCLRA